MLYVIGAGPGGVVAPSESVLALRWPPHLGWGPTWPFPGYLESFGVPVLLGLVGIRAAIRSRWEAGLVAAVSLAIGLAIPHAVEFRQNPWDTSKLFVPAMLAAAILGGPVLARYASRSKVRLPLTILILSSTLSPLLFLWVRALGPLGIDPALGPWPAVLIPPPAGGLDRAVGEWLGPAASPGDVVLAASPYVTAYSGVPSFAPRPDIWAWSQSLDPTGRFGSEHDRLWEYLHADELARHRIRWILVGPAERLKLKAVAQRALLDRRRFTLVIELGTGDQQRRLFRVHDRSR
jgi:hypothetical protein